MLAFSRSKYKDISGNKLFQTILNKGNHGEFLIFRLLEQQKEKYILTNVYIPTKENTTTEIDLVVINTSGIFVFESKNYSGWIFGSENNKNWTVSLQNGKKYQFLNPIWQNKLHISSLNLFLNETYSKYFYSYIIFSERCELKKLSYTSPNLSVLKRSGLSEHYNFQIDLMANQLTERQVVEIYEMLKPLTLVDEAVKVKHILDIKEKFEGEPHAETIRSEIETALPTENPHRKDR